MENIIRQMIMDSVEETIKDTIKKDNTICCVSKHILKSITEEAQKDKRVSIDKIKDLLTIQTVFITTNDKDLASKNLSKEQIEERISVLDVLQEMTNSLFADASNACNKRLDEFKDESQNKRKDELNELTKDELIDLITILEKEKEQK